MSSIVECDMKTEQGRKDAAVALAEQRRKVIDAIKAEMALNGVTPEELVDRWTAMEDRIMIITLLKNSNSGVELHTAFAMWWRDIMLGAMA